MNHGGEVLSQAMQQHVPAGIASRLDERYDADDPDALLDVYFPAKTPRPLPTIVWVHGGGFLAGHRGLVAPYLKILAARRSEEHTSELQSQSNLVCRLLLEKKKKTR